MRLRCVRGSWLGMTSSRPSAASSASAIATRSTSAASATARRLTRVTPHAGAVSSPFAARTGSSASHTSTAQSSPPHAPRLLAANLATLATAATASQTDCTHQSASHTHSHHHTHSHSHHHHHHHHHHSPYHPYLKPSAAASSVRALDSGEYDDADDDDAFLLPARKQQVVSSPPKPQFHPQHHHRLITARPSSKMPRRKETKKILLDVPSSEASRGIEGDPHQVFKCNGSPIISPRSIRNSLAETDCDVDGNPRPQKIAATTTDASTSGRTSQPSSAVLGPARPPSNDLTASPATSVNGSLKKPRRRRIGDSRPSTPSKSPTTNGSATGDSSKHTDMDLLALKVAEQSLAGMSGVQLWVHRMLYTHHQTLHMLGLERGDFPNTRLSMKQLETMLAPVISLANLMTPAYFGIHVPTPQIAQTMSDVHYWKLWESDTIDIGIFFMPPNSHIPLHNHPGMSVVTRILYGSVNIRSYDLVSPDDEVFQAIENGASTESSETSTDIVGADPKVMYARVSREGPYPAESTMWLDPRRFNLHQIHAASENGCAMLDIMIPPYNNADRDCHHFKILEEQYIKDKNERIVKMIESISKGNHNEPTASSRDAPTAATPSS